MPRIAIASIMMLLVTVGSAVAEPPPLALPDPKLLKDEEPTPKKLVKEEEPTPKKVIPEGPALPVLRIEDVSQPSPFKNYDFPDPPVDVLTLFGVRADFLAWRMRDAPIGVPIVVNRAASVVAIGNQSVDMGTFTGGRIGATLWLDRDHSMGVDVDGIFFGSRSVSLLLRSDGTGTPGYGRPFIDSATNQPFFIPISIPTQLDGGLGTTFTQRLSFADANLTGRLFENRAIRIDVLGGFRYADLREGLTITEGTQVINSDPTVTISGGNLGTLATGSSLIISDEIRVYNQFYGGQIGIRSTWTGDTVFATFTGKAGVGVNHETVRVNGGTALSPSTSAAGVAPVGGQNGFSTAQGLFAGPTNIGSQSRDETSFLGEANLTVGFNVSSRFKIYTGYSLLWWSNVVRAGGQLNNVINASQVPFNTNTPSTFGTNQPSVPFRQSDFWAFGWNVGASWEF